MSRIRHPRPSTGQIAPRRLPKVEQKINSMAQTPSPMQSRAINIIDIKPLTTTKNIIVVGSGRSLQGFNFNALRDLDCFIITVNGSGDAVPFADAWFTLDPWGLQGKQLPNNFNGELYAAVPDDYGTPSARCRDHRTLPTADIKYLRRVDYTRGLSDLPNTIHSCNSGFGAVGMAYHMNPQRILLLGIDGDIGYFYTDKQRNRKLDFLPRVFDESYKQLRNRGIAVINGSPNSTVTCFNRCTPDEGLRRLLS